MKEKLKSFLAQFFSLVIKIIILAIVTYILFNIGRSIWKNWQLNQKVKTAQEEISRLEENNKMFQDQILYYQTDTFKELEARSKLGLKKPDENMILAPENVDPAENKEAGKTKTAKNGKNDDEIPNPIKWWHYLIGNK